MLVAHLGCVVMHTLEAASVELKIMENRGRAFNSHIFSSLCVIPGTR